ncbi:hypothetical protein BD413DRAFT_579692 [Trametes elegans]|nr:hypothetical protein BD413DRAFT_579692 [Trametes elegans]
MVILTPNLILVASISTSQTSDPLIHSKPAVDTRTQDRLSEVEAFPGRTIEAAAVRLCEISIGSESKTRYYNIRMGFPGLTSSPGNLNRVVVRRPGLAMKDPSVSYESLQ